MFALLEGRGGEKESEMRLIEKVRMREYRGEHKQLLLTYPRLLRVEGDMEGCHISKCRNNSKAVVTLRHRTPRKS